MFNCVTGLQISSQRENVETFNNKISQGDFSLSGIIMMNLLNTSQGIFKARTIIDSGAGTNFISRKILPHIKYESLDSEGLAVTGINSKTNKKYELIKIYLNNKECPVKHIRCYVLPDLIEYEIINEELKQMIEECKNIKGFNDPLSQVADHKEGISIVLGPGATRDISYAPPLWHGKYTIDRTYFGPAVSGRIQKSKTTRNLMATLTKLDNIDGKNILRLEEWGYEEKLEQRLKLLKELEFLSSKEMFGVKK